MDPSINEIWPAIVLVKQNPLAKAAFEVVTRNLGISGYAVARQLDKEPTLVQSTLASLRDINVIASGSADLRANFTLTGSGFRLKQFLGQM